MSDLLAKLKEKEQKLKAEIRKAQAQIASEAAKTHKKRCQIIGAAILEEMAQSKDAKAAFNQVLDRHIKSTKDRLLIGLDTVEVKEEKKENLAPQGEMKTPSGA